jgi:3'(2'), 5'-bisphosphate nucleotidase
MEAGNRILETYNNDNNVESIKVDKSPLTQADLDSHNHITESLRSISSLPILSEESDSISFKERKSWKRYWLIDPLDGTKEFLKRNGEFTVNIALIENNKPILGVIHSPVLKETYWGSKKNGSYFQKNHNQAELIKVSSKQKGTLRILTSRSHMNDELNQYISKKNDVKIIKMGSSLKFCLIANGTADIYPRHGPTSEWDIAAGHAIVKFAGGSINSLSGDEMSYNVKDSLINPSFIVSSSKKLSEDFFVK